MFINDLFNDKNKTLNEVSNELLGRYKKAAGADASAADKAGDIERGNKRFKGIVKATVKQGENDVKKHKTQGVAEGSLNEFAPDGFDGGDDDEGFSPEIAKMAQEDGFTKGVSLADGATLERAITINYWHSQHGGMYKQYFAKGFKAGRMNKIRHSNKQYNLNLKLMKDGSIGHGLEGVAEAGPFSYGAKKPRKGSVADLAAKKRKEQEQGQQPIEPKDQQVGVAKVTKGVAEGLPQTLRKVVPGYAKREIDKKMDAQKFGRTDVDKDANYYRYKKIQDKIKEQGVSEGGILDDLLDAPGKVLRTAQDAARGIPPGTVPDSQDDLVNTATKIGKQVIDTATDAARSMPTGTVPKPQKDKDVKEQTGMQYNPKGVPIKSVQPAPAPLNVPQGWEAKTQADGSTRISKQGSMSSAEYKQNMADYKAKNWTPEKMADYGQRMASGQGYTDAEKSANYQQQQQHFGQYADNPLDEQGVAESAKCNMTEEGRACPNHGVMECPGYSRLMGEAFKMPPESLQDRMYRQHQELRKKRGAPDPSHYKELAKKKQQEIDALRAEIEADKAKGLKEDRYLEELQRAGYEVIAEKKVTQRLDPKCWKGKHKEGTKIKGGVRVNNCVPNK